MMGARVGVVGGSVAGCLTAAALIRGGHDVHVFERSPEKLQERGAGITVPRALLETLKAADLVDADWVGPSAAQREWRVQDGQQPYGRLMFTEPMGGGVMQHWGGLYANLRRRIPSERYHEGAALTEAVNAGDAVRVGFADGSHQTFDLLVGADGYRSALRRVLFPGAEPRYAGYSAWRGIISEADIDDPGLVDGTVQMVGVPRGQLAVYLVPGARGELEPGRRHVNWLIYDAGAPEDVAGITRDGSGRMTGRTVAAGGLSREQLEYLSDLAERHLPPWHRELVNATEGPYLQSLHDLTLERFSAGRIVLVGDAATIARPHTGSGAAKAINDGLALADAMASNGSIAAALGAYESVRVTAGNDLVRLGQELGRSQVVEAPDWPRLAPDGYEALLYGGAASQTYFGAGSAASATASDSR